MLEACLRDRSKRSFAAGRFIGWAVSVFACGILAGDATAAAIKPFPANASADKIVLALRPPSSEVHGMILAQQLDGSNRGYTVIRLWGTPRQIGYAHGTLLGEYIVEAVGQVKDLVPAWEYAEARTAVQSAVWLPADIEEEFAGMLEALTQDFPEAGVDVLDLKVVNAMGDLLYACRSHTCWGRYVEAPLKTLSTRRLDFARPFAFFDHHVLAAIVPADGGVRWVNLTSPGGITVCTGINEFGTLVSLHDYESEADLAPGRMSRMVACRYALTEALDNDLSTHLSSVFGDLQDYEVMTGSFINYYAPEGHGGVMVCNPWRSTTDFYYLRRPQPGWHHGEAMITTNRWTDGSYTPSDEDFGADAYYNNESPKTLASHWNLLNRVDLLRGMHLMSVAYRGREDMTIWAAGRIGMNGQTARLEYEWSQLFPAATDFNFDGRADLEDLATLSENWSQTGSSVLQTSRADLNYDGEVDVQDLVVLAGTWLQPD